jgi:valyl-tRNA synthetase
MPFVTEEAWSYIPHEGEALIMARWPGVDARYLDDTAEAQMNTLMEMVRGIRNVRGEYSVEPGMKITALVAPGSHRANIEAYSYLFTRLCNVPQIEILTPGAPAPEDAASIAVGDVTVYLPLKGMIDVDAECARLNKERERLAAQIAKTEGMLGNESFVSRAKPEVVQRERDRLAELQAESAQIVERLASLCG